MISHELKIRVRYAEVDRMGYLHHGNYAAYFESGRTELLRELGLTYRQMEDNGIILPVRELNIRYFEPILYDEEILLHTIVTQLPAVRLEFKYMIENSLGTKCCEAKAVLVFVNSKTRKPTRAPEYFLKLIKPFF